MFSSSGWNSFCQFAVCAHRVSFCLFFLYKHSKSVSTQCLLNVGYSRCWIHFCSILATHSITWSGLTSNDRNCLAKSRGRCFPCSRSSKDDFIILSLLTPSRHEDTKSVKVNLKMLSPCSLPSELKRVGRSYHSQSTNLWKPRVHDSLCGFFSLPLTVATTLVSRESHLRWPCG